jgi:hypothetical protein
LLKTYNKGIRPCQSIEATKVAKAHKLRVGWYLVASSLDTSSTIGETAGMVKMCSPDLVYISVLSVKDDIHHKKGRENAKLLKAEIASTKFAGQIYGT